MARPLWTGSIGFGLVNVPVKMFTAVSPKELHFHQLHDKDNGRIHYKRVCDVDGKEVPYEHIVKGYETAKDEYVVTTSAELAKFVPEATKSIDIEEFVALAEIDPVYFEHTYYLVPDKGASKPYALLAAALEDAGRVGIGRVVLRTRQYLCAVRPVEGALAMSTMQFDDEVIKVEDLEGLPSKTTKPSAKELAMAKQLIGFLEKPFEPAKYHDTYREEVKAMLEKKARGEAIVKPKTDKGHAPVVDLMEALKASLAKGKAEPAKKSAKHPKKAHHASKTKKAA